mmetsp:Transcript_22393/g.63550  ORF Transcript_22393/g.63550 Transcript_22393/m.63550 type:complete len:205 (-) Transcript_22393:771-1385(-)
MKFRLRGSDSLYRTELLPWLWRVFLLRLRTGARPCDLLDVSSPTIATSFDREPRLALTTCSLGSSEPWRSNFSARVEGEAPPLGEAGGLACLGERGDASSRGEREGLACLGERGEVASRGDRKGLAGLGERDVASSCLPLPALRAEWIWAGPRSGELGGDDFSASLFSSAALLCSMTMFRLPPVWTKSSGRSCESSKSACDLIR